MQIAFNITSVMRSNNSMSNNSTNEPIGSGYNVVISKKYAMQCNCLNRPIGNARTLGAIESIAYYKAI